MLACGSASLSRNSGSGRVSRMTIVVALGRHPRQRAGVRRPQTRIGARRSRRRTCPRSGCGPGTAAGSSRPRPPAAARCRRRSGCRAAAGTGTAGPPRSGSGSASARSGTSSVPRLPRHFAERDQPVMGEAIELPILRRVVDLRVQRAGRRIAPAAAWSRRRCALGRGAGMASSSASSSEADHRQQDVGRAVPEPERLLGPQSRAGIRTAPPSPPRRRVVRIPLIGQVEDHQRPRRPQHARRIRQMVLDHRRAGLDEVGKAVDRQHQVERALGQHRQILPARSARSGHWPGRRMASPRLGDHAGGDVEPQHASGSAAPAPPRPGRSRSRDRARPPPAAADPCSSSHSRISAVAAARIAGSPSE